MPNPFYVEPLPGFQAHIGKMGQAIEKKRLADVEQKKQDKLQKTLQAMGEINLQDPAAVAKFAVQNPGHAKTLIDASTFASDATRRDATESAFMAGQRLLAGQPIDDLVARRSALVTEAGGDPSGTDSMLGMDVDSQKREVAMVLAGSDNPIHQKVALELMGWGAGKKYQQGTGDTSGLVFDESTGTYKEDPVAMQAILDKAQKAAQEADEKGNKVNAKTRQGINKDVTLLLKDSTSIYKAAKDLAALKASSSPMSQLAAVFKFMKALDPTSVVREGEQTQARTTGGPADAFVGLANKLQGEGALPPGAFSDMVDTAMRLSDSGASASREALVDYLDVYGDTLQPELKQKLLNRTPGFFTEPGTQAELPREEGMGMPEPLPGQRGPGSFSVEEQPGLDAVVISSHPVHGDITEADIIKTMTDTGMTREQVLQAIGG